MSGYDVLYENIIKRFCTYLYSMLVVKFLSLKIIHPEKEIRKGMYLEITVQ